MSRKKNNASSERYISTKLNPLTKKIFNEYDDLILRHVTHEGVQVEKGRRYLLIGFLSIDNVDPFDENLRSSGLSWFASWFSTVQGTTWLLD